MKKCATRFSELRNNMKRFNKKKFEAARDEHFGIKRIVDNKLKGAYGETDTHDKIVRINKKAHKRMDLKRVNKNPNGTESLVDTIVHEEMHAKHPKMHEKTVRKKAKKVVARLSQAQKRKVRNKYH